MEVTELENVGKELCHSLMNRDYVGIAKKLGYAIAFQESHAMAIEKDFESSILESGGILEQSKFNVQVKTFPRGKLGFINLVECRFIFPNSTKEVLAEIIENEAGCYLEQISCVA